MAMPIDMMLLKKFDEEHYSPPENIVEMRDNIDRLYYIVRKNELKNQAVMKETYDSKVTPDRFYQGQRCYLNDPVAKIGECTKIRRRWRGLFVLFKNSSHNVFLYNPDTNKHVEKSATLTELNHATSETMFQKMMKI